MKRYIKYSLVIISLLLLANLYPINRFFIIFIEGVWVEGIGENCYSTKDKVFIHIGMLEAAKHDPYFNRYKLTHPHNDWTLYRIDKMPYLKFWRWGEILTEEKWRQPYLEVSGEYANKLFNAKRTQLGFYGDSLRRLEVERYEDKDYKRSQGQEIDYK